MQKYTKDRQIAILISPGWGAGWSTWNEKEISFDKRVVEKFLQNVSEQEMQKYLDSIGYENVYTGGYCQLEIRWLPEGTKYHIIEHGGETWVEEDFNCCFVIEEIEVEPVKPVEDPNLVKGGWIGREAECCGNCGNNLRLTAKFCDRCGREVGREELTKKMLRMKL